MWLQFGWFRFQRARRCVRVSCNFRLILRYKCVRCSTQPMKQCCWVTLRTTKRFRVKIANFYNTLRCVLSCSLLISARFNGKMSELMHRRITIAYNVPTGTIFFPFSFFKNKRMERQMREWIVKMQVYNLIPNLINKKFTAHCFIFADTNFLWHSETGRAFYNNAENIKKKWYCLGLLFFEEMKYSRNILIVYFWKYS